MKLTAYILLVALFVASVGMSLFYFPELNAIRQNMQQKLEQKNERIEWAFSVKNFEQLEWTRKEKEFRYKGRMYDVASVKKVGNRIFVSCIFDKEETGLRRKLKDFFSPASRKNAPIRQMVKVLSQKYFAPVGQLFSGGLNGTLLCFQPYFYSLSIFKNEPVDPPPVVFC